MSIESTKEILDRGEMTDADIVHLLGLTDPKECALLQKAAYDRTTELMGDFVYYRGLIEFSNICTASCRYCGIRRDNHALQRYTMTKDEIVGAAVWAARAGYGSVCLQAGERRDEKFVAFVEECLKEIHEKTVSEALPEGLGITVSLGEQSEETYRRWAKAAGCPHALRYLARFETSNPKLFALLHGAKGDHEKKLEHRYELLKTVQRCGYQMGTGVMIGIPGQTLEDLCRDIRKFQELGVDMIGMGPYLLAEGGDMLGLGQMEPHRLLQLALNMIAVTRLTMGPVNIAAATALQAIRDDGREIGVEYGANVVMPNISAQKYREGYQLYNNKPCLDDEPTQCASCLERRLTSKGRRVGWNMTGSSRLWLKNHGLKPEAPSKSVKPLIMPAKRGRTIWISAVSAK
ncbi:MAG: Iron-only hydrogenase maturation rSAM protein HydE [Burkholderia sp.]|jgi:biotin synthase